MLGDATLRGLRDPLDVLFDGPSQAELLADRPGQSVHFEQPVWRCEAAWPLRDVADAALHLVLPVEGAGHGVVLDGRPLLAEVLPGDRLLLHELARVARGQRNDRRPVAAERQATTAEVCTRGNVAGVRRSES